MVPAVSGPAGQSFKINPFLLDHGWPPENLRVNRSDVFAEQPDEDELNRADKEHTDHQWRRSQLEAVPKQQLV